MASPFFVSVSRMFKNNRFLNITKMLSNFLTYRQCGCAERPPHTGQRQEDRDRRCPRREDGGHNRHGRYANHEHALTIQMEGDSNPRGLVEGTDRTVPLLYLQNGGENATKMMLQGK